MRKLTATLRRNEEMVDWNVPFLFCPCNLSKVWNKVQIGLDINLSGHTRKHACAIKATTLFCTHVMKDVADIASLDLLRLLNISTLQYIGLWWLRVQRRS